MAKTKKTKTAEVITEEYQYKGEGVLIQDKPSEPLTVNIVNISNKDKYYSLATEGINFILKYKGSIIYDTTGKLNKIFKDLSFDEEYFTLYGEKYSYDGLMFKFKRK